MNQDDIMRLAREAGFEHIAEADYWHPYFARFAALAYAAGAAAEREACVEACQNCVMYGPVIEAQQRYNQAYWHCVEAIRARGNK
jgi:hypothetical protein